MSSNTKKDAVLVYRSASLGDYIMTLPAFHMIREKYPNSLIILITTTSNHFKTRGACDNATKDSLPEWIELGMTYIDYVVYYSTLSVRLLFDLRSRFGSLSIKESIVLTEDCINYKGRLKKLLFMAIIGRSVGKISRIHKLVDPKQNPLECAKQKKLRHHVDALIDSVEKNDSNVDILTGSQIFVSRRKLHSSNAIWNKKAKNTARNNIVIGLSPGSIRQHKQWPIERFIKLIGSLLDKNKHYLFVVFGTSGDVDLGRAIYEKYPNYVLDLTGLATIVESYLMMKHCDIFITNDGGAAHLADLSLIPVVTVTPSIEYPNSIEPWRNKALSIRSETGCAPCYDFITCPLETFECIRSIQIEDVLEILMKNMEKDDKYKGI